MQRNALTSGFGSPVMNESTFRDSPRWDQLATAKAEAKATSMSIEGTVWATGIMLATTFVTGSITYGALESRPGLGAPLMFGGMILGLILALVIIFKKNLAPVLGIPYAIVEGVFVGAISLFYANYAGAQAASSTGGGVAGVVGASDPSIVYQAMALTFGVAGGMLVAYSFRIIRVGNTFMKVVCALTFGYVAVVMLTWLLSMFTPIPSMGQVMFSGGPLGIGIALIAPILATLNLLVDFKVIEEGAKARAPKHMNWFCGFAVLVTMVWLYLSLLRLLAILRGND